VSRRSPQFSPQGKLFWRRGSDLSRWLISAERDGYFREPTVARAFAAGPVASVFSFPTLGVGTPAPEAPRPESPPSGATPIPTQSQGTSDVGAMAGLRAVCCLGKRALPDQPAMATGGTETTSCLRRAHGVSRGLSRAGSLTESPERTARLTPWARLGMCLGGRGWSEGRAKPRSERSVSRVPGLPSQAQSSHGHPVVARRASARSRPRRGNVSK